MAKTKVVICPYCGESQPAGDLCRSCGGYFDELSRQATHNDMGPWFLRNIRRTFQPGCSYETIIKLIDRGQIDKYTIIRGPTSKQFWTIARRVPGISHLLGYCHNCDAKVGPDEHGCPTCGELFGAYLDRNMLGLPEIKPLPWEASIGEEEQPPSPLPSPASWSTPTDTRGISSFANDSEIASVTPGDPYLESVSMTSTVEYGGAPAPAAHDPATASATTPAGNEPTASASSTTRSLRRKLDQQRRMVTMLMVLLVITIVLMLISNLDRLAGFQNGQSETNPTAVKDESESIAPDETKVANESKSDIYSGAARYEDAVTLIASAGDQQQAMADRIADFEMALAVLKALKASVPKNQQPDDLNALIEQAEKDLEKLKMRDLLP